MAEKTALVNPYLPLAEQRLQRVQQEFRSSRSRRNENGNCTTPSTGYAMKWER